MALSDTDLLLVQKGSVPHKTTAAELASYTNSKIQQGDIPIASATQLGVIKVGANLEITADGTLSAVTNSGGGGLNYKGTWFNPNSAPPNPEVSDFWIWDGGNATLNNVFWGSANGQSVTEGDFLPYDGTTFSVIANGSGGGGGGGGGLTEITGTTPVFVSPVANEQQNVFMPAATSNNDGYMPKEAFEQLDTLVNNPTPSGVSSVLAGDYITVNTTVAPGTTATPQINVTENSFIPYNISTLQVLPA